MNFGDVSSPWMSFMIARNIRSLDRAQDKSPKENYSLTTFPNAWGCSSKYVLTIEFIRLFIEPTECNLTVTIESIFSAQMRLYTGRTILIYSMSLSTQSSSWLSSKRIEVPSLKY